MILQQTLSRSEKIIGMFAVLFLVALVAFGYTQTVIGPAQASVLHAEKIGEDYDARYSKLATHFDVIRNDINLAKSSSVKSKLRSIKECLLNAQEPTTKTEIPSARVAFASCEKLFIETEEAVDTLSQHIENIDSNMQKLEKSVQDYEKVVDQALRELKKKNDATLGTVEH